MRGGSCTGVRHLVGDWELGELAVEVVCVWVCANVTTDLNIQLNH